MSDAKRIAAFLKLAEEELQAAQALALGAPRQAAYFVQQAAEKIARAILTKERIPFGPSHNLGQMAAELGSGHPWRAKIMAFDRLSPAATRYRYPGPTGHLPEPPPTETIKADIRDVASFLKDARQYIESRQDTTGSR